MFLAVLVLPACNQSDTAALSRAKDRMAEATQAADKIAARIKGVMANITQIRADIETMRIATADATDAAKRAEREAEDISKDMDSYVSAYLTQVQNKARGMALGDITVSGRVFRGVKVKSLDPWEVTFMHSEGVGKLALRDLPDDLKIKLGYNPDAGVKPDAPVAAAQGKPQGPGQRAAAPAAETNSSGGNAESLPPGVDGPPMVVRSSDGGISVSGKRLGKIVIGSDGTSSEIIADLTRPVGVGGTKIKGAGSSLPPGYKPAGSSFTGSDLGRTYNPGVKKP